ncbi:hypothetical protein [Pararhizobium gei]|uniref:hypothetical protein n=1 Tax=Pararhizobium gei TaxID=1395951 RepID=UPI0023DC5929|nr:hypothetical protein [Rhizobium gei]
MNEDGFRIWRHALGKQDFIDISLEEYEALKNARYVLTEMTSFEEKFFAVSESYKTVEQFIHEATLDTLLGRQIDIPGIRGVGAEFGRVTSLLLSSIRMYQDTMGSHFREITGSDKALEKAKSLKSDKYDTSFEYRFMEAVRNYSQHRSFPVHSSKYGGNMNKEMSEITYETEFTFDVSKVVDDKFKTAIRSEVADRGGTVSLKSAVRTYFADICDIHSSVKELAKHEVADAETVMKRWQEEWTSVTGSERLVGICAVRFEGEILDKAFPIIYIGPQLDEYRLRLRQKTDPLTNLHIKRVKL